MIKEVNHSLLLFEWLTQWLCVQALEKKKKAFQVELRLRSWATNQK